MGVCASAEEVFAALERASDARVRYVLSPLSPSFFVLLLSTRSHTPSAHSTASRDPYRRLQRALILKQYPQIPAELAATVQALLSTTTSASTSDSTSAPASGSAAPADSALVAHGNYLVFAVHLYLYIHALLYPPTASAQSQSQSSATATPTATPAHMTADEHGTAVLTAYLRYLRATEQPQLVAVYARFLPAPQLVSVYAEFLRSMGCAVLCCCSVLL